MARQLETDEEIDKFIMDIRRAAEHHGPNVHSIIQLLSDEVRERLDLKRDTVEVYERNGKLARTCWITIGGKRYVFSYNYNREQIEIKKRSIRGAVIFSVDNATPRAKIVCNINKL